MPISAAQAPKGKCFLKTWKFPWGIICHFATLRLLQHFYETNISYITVFYAEENVVNHQITMQVMGKEM